MFNINKVIHVKKNEVFINTIGIERFYNRNNDYMFRIDSDTLKLKIYVDKKLIQEFVVNTINDEESFKGKYFHFRLIIRANHALMIDGLLTRSKSLDVTLKENLPIRFQPIFISNTYFDVVKLKGKGLFARGFHFSGTVTPANTRLVCVCDVCRKTFTIQSYHSGFSDSAYFYSDDGLNTLTISSWEYPGLPGINTKEIDYNRIKEIESELPTLSDGQSFKYYNSFCCPHCLSPYIDYVKYPEDRQCEYYGNVHAGKKFIKHCKK